MSDRLNNIVGLVDETGIETLQRLAQDKVVCEVGVWQGKTAVAMAETARLVVAVDHHLGDEWIGRQNSLPMCWENVQGLKNLVLMVGPWQLVLPTLQLGQFELFHYDADHSYEATTSFIELVRRESPRAVIIVDDYGPHFPEVQRAVDSVTNFRKTLTGTKMMLEPV